LPSNEARGKTTRRICRRWIINCVFCFLAFLAFARGHFRRSSLSTNLNRQFPLCLSYFLPFCLSPSLVSLFFNPPSFSLTFPYAFVFVSFPSHVRSFVDRILAAEAGTTDLSNALTLTQSLTKMADALFQSLNYVASSGGTDKQYASDVMLIENSHFFKAAVSQRAAVLTDLFAPQLRLADGLYRKSVHAYVKFMVKREFKGLFVLFQTIARIRKDVGDSDVPIHCPRATFIRTLSKEAASEVLTERVNEIRKRMEKHLSADSFVLSKLWNELESVLLAEYKGFEKVSAFLYNYRFEASKEELQRILRLAGGEFIRRMRSDGSDRSLFEI